MRLVYALFSIFIDLIKGAYTTGFSNHIPAVKQNKQDKNVLNNAFICFQETINIFRQLSEFI